MRTNLNAFDCTRGCTDTVEESALTVDWEKNPLPHRGIEPASAACRSDALTNWATFPLPCKPGDSYQSRVIPVSPVIGVTRQTRAENPLCWFDPTHPFTFGFRVLPLLFQTHQRQDREGERRDLCQPFKRRGIPAWPEHIHTHYLHRTHTHTLPASNYVKRLVSNCVKTNRFEQCKTNCIQLCINHGIKLCTKTCFEPCKMNCVKQIWSNCQMKCIEQCK